MEYRLLTNIYFEWMCTGISLIVCTVTYCITSFLLEVGEEEVERGVGEGEGEGCRGVLSDASPPTVPPFFERGMIEEGREGGRTSPA